MLVPRFWAECSKQGRAKGRSVTVKRFGWSNQNQAEADRHAEQRAAEALARIESGESLKRKEPKRGYNGADGVPIREEILATHGNAIITRNGYGAKCLNTPNVFFADIDLETLAASWFWIGLLEGIGAVVAGGLAYFWLEAGWRSLWLYMLLGSVLCYPAVWLLRKFFVLAMGGEERLALWRIKRFLAARPDWHLRIYRTPAGLRLLAMHRTFDPSEMATQEFFERLGCDPVYARMCQNQKCFRARVSPKPWRMGAKIGHIPPRRGVWPIPEAYLSVRTAWLQEYESLASGFASCRFLEEAGSGLIDPAARGVQVLHDDLCRSESALPLA